MSTDRTVLACSGTSSPIGRGAPGTTAARGDQGPHDLAAR